ncbi:MULTISPECIES: MutS-related protein [Methanobacterium]|uniref:DNA-binding protein MutS2 n=1 Tax=Methanobacterium subterraneum TaxID=59277 RepID=A0A2H4VQI8_9EURY|nr:MULTISPECIES: helix-hairpin-helix domain-containing protein [Methanobacterium]AUB60369.1 DNA mismatch repair protein MutS [Methanobacterium subterraneum]MBW4258128.1 endonuclease MutS2 [Methanobacterium sp. YSL]MCC7558854.1 endonuclease MutS2 [Methanobacterium sp.]NMO09132.1 endonuclease MutS2 [Methanobacterium subterraneum]
MDLRDIKGIGDKLASRIINHFGSQEEFLQAAGNYDVYRLASMEGVSQRRAVEIINAVLGNPTEEFLKTERAVQIYEEIIQSILKYANTEYAKNRVLLLSPGKNKAKIQENLNMVMAAKEKVAQLPRDDLKALFRNVNPSSTSKPRYDTSKAILVESNEDYTRLMDRQLNQHAQILNIQEVGSLDEFELVVYIYREGILELDETSNLVMVNCDSEDLEIIPEIVLSYYHKNQALLENILKIRQILQYPSVLGDVLRIMDSIENSPIDEKVFDTAVNQAKDHADRKLEEAIKKVDLSGEEVLDLLNKGMSPKIQEIFDEILKEAVKKIKEYTGISFDPFIQKYPLEIDEQELERVKKREVGKKEVKAFEERVKVASQLQLLKGDVEMEIQEVLEFDYQFTLGCFAFYHDLRPPQMGDGFRFKEGLHLNLAREDPSRVQRINYSLESPDNVVLLTGANSGGKTTLLETLAQISIMSHMGLPVCAREAQVKLIDELYFFSKKRSLDAGAFESFLSTFMPIVVREEDKLILLDELEAITELEAAVKIISSFIDFIQDSKSFAIIVTHMAREILKTTNVRVDGIEAQGLDDEYNLIVDRTPRMNYFARSTPELILRMVHQRSDGKLKDIYGKMLERF